jgi:hypothetical protein
MMQSLLVCTTVILNLQLDLVNNRDFIFASLPLSSVEAMMNVKMHHFENIYDGRQLIRSTDLYTIPSSLVEHIDLITGISSFPMGIPNSFPKLTQYRISS